MPKIIFVSIIVFNLFLSIGYSQIISDSLKRKIKQSTKQPIFELQRDLDAILDSPDISNAFVGISVLNLESSEFFYRKNDYKNFIPASLIKMLTSSAALNYLGEDFRFNTKLYLNGYLAENGEFNGDIIVRGGGDPTLSKNFYKEPLDVLNQFANALDSLGIKSINGNIIGDDNYFDDEYYAPGWAWDDFMYPFSAQINALSIYENKIDIIVKPNQILNQIAEYRLEPNTKYVQVINNVQTLSPKAISDVVVYKEIFSNFVQMSGGIIRDSLGKEEVQSSVAVDNPTLYFLHLLKDCIDKHNIKVRGVLLDIDDYRETITYSDLHLISTIYSPPLKSIIPVMNKQSNNLIAESILKTVAKEVTGKGAFQTGTELLAKFASKSGISAEKISLYDGSGLSRMTVISPKNFVTLLSYMYRNEDKDIFINSLAIPGESGTLKRRLTKSVAQKQLWAKSGSMNGINNLSGYIKTKDNEMLAFAIMIMNDTVPQTISSNIIDLICMRLAAFSRKKEL